VSPAALVTRCAALDLSPERVQGARTRNPWYRQHPGPPFVTERLQVRARAVRVGTAAPAHRVPLAIQVRADDGTGWHRVYQDTTKWSAFYTAFFEVTQ
jgi:hypothetical protein